jgi:putative hemolysin
MIPPALKEAIVIRKNSFVWLMPVILLLVAACTLPRTSQTTTPEANLPNPASAYCEEQGNTLEIVTAADGSQSGVCHFPDGSSCDEWAYFRGECGPEDSLAEPEPSQIPPVNLSNPASVYCEEQGNTLEIVTAADGSQSGVCIFPDGSSCDEWAYLRGECGPEESPRPEPGETLVDPAEAQGWWVYTNPAYNFTLLLPAGWVAEAAPAGDPLLYGHMLNLHPQDEAEKESIRVTFRHVGEDTLLWPTGVGQGEFVSQGTLEVAGQPAQRMLLVCPGGEITSIWYHQAEGMPNIRRGNLEFGFIFSAAPSHCEAGYSLRDNVQQMGEKIIASLKVP